MKNLIFLVFCGFIALEANGVRVRVFLQESEENGLEEETVSSGRRLGQYQKRFVKKDPREYAAGGGSESLEQEKMLELEGDKMDVQPVKSEELDKMNIGEMFDQVIKHLDQKIDQKAKKAKKDEYDKSVDKILNAVRKIVTNDEPLLYAKEVGCGKGVTFKCQYTSNETEDVGFYGYQAVPRITMMRAMAAVDKLVSHPLVNLYVNMLDYSVPESAEEGVNDYTSRVQTGEQKDKFKFGKLLMFVKRIVHRDPEELPQKFVCGIQMDNEKTNCRYYDKGNRSKPLLGLRFDAAGVNDAVKNIFTSRALMKGLVDFANSVTSIFPALNPGKSTARSTTQNSLDEPVNM